MEERLDGEKLNLGGSLERSWWWEWVAGVCVCVCVCVLQERSEEVKE
jgi:hypothetical protein